MKRTFVTSKKTFAIALALLLILSAAAMGEGAAIPGIADGTVLLDNGGIKIYATEPGRIELYNGGEPYLVFGVVIENSADQSLCVTIDQAYVNGWKSGGDTLEDVAPGKKAKDEIHISLADAGITTLDEIEEIEISWHVFALSDFSTVFDLGPVVIDMK